MMVSDDEHDDNDDNGTNKRAGYTSFSCLRYDFELSYSTYLYFPGEPGAEVSGEEYKPK